VDDGSVLLTDRQKDLAAHFAPAELRCSAGSGVSRLLFSDFPLRNSAGRPNDAASRAYTLELALRILGSA